jgi:hypothetical protein
MLRAFGFGLIIALSLVGSIHHRHEWSGTGIAATPKPSCSISTCGGTTQSDTARDIAGNRLTAAGQRSEKSRPDSNPWELCNENVETDCTPPPTEISVGQKNILPKVSQAIAIRYVSQDGSDANDGLSWVSAKRTIYAAFISLPGGGPKTAGSGTIYVGPASLANPNAGAGIWLMNPSDPNYTSPPPGWLKCNGCSGQVIGIANQAGGPNSHMPRAFIVSGGIYDNNHPSIWLSGLQEPWNFMNIEFEYPGRGVVIGECSNNLRTGRCGVSNQTFQNVAGEIQQNRTSGPCTDITGGTFWIWLRDYGCGGNAYHAAGGITANNAAAILIDGTGNAGNGLIHISDTNLAGGGIKFIPGANGGGLYARNVIQEGDYTHKLPPTIWFTVWCSSCDAVLENIQLADGSGTESIIQTDGTQGPGPTVFNSGGIVGPATVINPTPSAFVGGKLGPKLQRQTGFFNGYMVGETDVARRIVGLVPSRFANRANTNSSTWTNPYPVRSRILRGVADPYGGKEAATATSISSKTDPQNLQLGSCTPYKPTPGDWIVVGLWGKGVGPSYTYPTGACYGASFPTISTSFYDYGLNAGDGQWMHQWVAYKVSGGSPTSVNANIGFTASGGPITIYGPTLFIIPAGTLSDSEVLEFASSMNSVDSNCKVGEICNVAGHPIVVSSYGTLSNCSSNASPARCDSAPAGSFVLGVGSIIVRVNTTAVTANSQILIIEDSSLGAKLGVSCNKTTGRTYMITDRAPGVSFTVSASLAPTEHPACLSFQLLN